MYQAVLLQEKGYYIYPLPYLPQALLLFLNFSFDTLEGWDAVHIVDYHLARGVQLSYLLAAIYPQVLSS